MKDHENNGNQGFKAWQTMGRVLKELWKDGGADIVAPRVLRTLLDLHQEIGKAQSSQTVDTPWVERRFDVLERHILAHAKPDNLQQPWLFTRTEGDVRCIGHVINLAVQAALKILKAEPVEEIETYQIIYNSATIPLEF